MTVPRSQRALSSSAFCFVPRVNVTNIYLPNLWGTNYVITMLLIGNNGRVNISYLH